MRAPPQINAENIFKAFLELSGERYPTPDKVLKLSRQLGIEGNIPAQIVVFGVFRDMVREASPNYIFRSIQHRDDVFNAIIAALEDLEDKYEELQERQMREELEEAKRLDNQPLK